MKAADYAQVMWTEQTLGSFVQDFADICQNKRTTKVTASVSTSNCSLWKKIILMLNSLHTQQANVYATQPCDPDNSDGALIFDFIR